MFAINSLEYAKVSSVPLGNLILCTNYSSAAAELAIRVAVPEEKSTDTDGVLFLKSATHWGDAGAVVYGQYGDQLCLDLGIPQFAISDDSIGAAILKRPYDARLGMLALSGPDLFILSAFGRYGHHQAWWNVSSGKQTACEERLVVERWCVGLIDLNQKFIPQLRYPEDFKRDASAP